MNIGIFSGSFNPIHIGHVILANYIVEFTDLDEVWFLVSPQNPLKNTGILDERQRFEMAKLAIAGYPKLKASDFEFSLPRPSYTVNTLNTLNVQFPEHTFSLIIGSDNWSVFDQWKDYKTILSDYKLYVYPRLHTDALLNESLCNNVIALNAPIIEISSTFIREALTQNKNMKAFLPPNVYQYITDNKLYKL